MAVVAAANRDQIFAARDLVFVGKGRGGPAKHGGRREELDQRCPHLARAPQVIAVPIARRRNSRDAIHTLLSHEQSAATRRRTDPAKLSASGSVAGCSAAAGLTRARPRGLRYSFFGGAGSFGTLIFATSAVRSGTVVDTPRTETSAVGGRAATLPTGLTNL